MNPGVKQWIASALGSLTLIVTTGCGPALQPFYTASDLFEDPALEGRWTDGKESWEFHRVGDGKYTISECDPDCKNPAPATLFRLGGTVFVDFQEAGGSFSSAVYPHGILRVRLSTDQVEVTGLEEDALKGLSNISINQRVLITAPTSKLQQFLLRHAADPQAWGETQVYQRAADPAGARPSQSGS
jgi:hypothetical protein